MRISTQKGGGEMPAVPITVRQLEAIVRISESLARMQLQVDVTENHVQQAMDLFRTSTMDAVRAGATEGLVCNSANTCCTLHGTVVPTRNHLLDQLLNVLTKRSIGFSIYGLQSSCSTRAKNQRAPHYSWYRSRGSWFETCTEGKAAALMSKNAN